MDEERTETEALANIRERRFEVDQNFEGWRLDRFVAARIGRLSRARVGQIVRGGGVSVIPDRRVRPALVLRRGDVVVVRQTLPPEAIQDGEVVVLHRDEALVILSKPAGMLAMETASARLNTVEGYLRRAGFEGAYPAHRLDRETSGALVCAADAPWRNPLQNLFAQGEVRKTYRALAVDPGGRWPVGHREWLETPLGILPDSLLGVRVGRGPLEARTHVTVLGRLAHPMGPLADLEVRILTGRQHQIRAHLAMEGTPVAGDKLYTFDDLFFQAICADPDDPELSSRLPFDRHALHAWIVELPHPDGGAPVRLEAPLPALWSLPFAPG